MPWMKTVDKNTRDFFVIVSIGTAVAFGLLAASLQSLRPSAAGFSFQLSAGTYVAFALGAGLGVVYWTILSQMTRAGRGKSSKLLGLSLLLVAGGGVAFLYPLRYVSPEKFKDISMGLGFAFLALSCVGLMLWTLTRFLNQDSASSHSDVQNESRSG